MGYSPPYNYIIHTPMLSGDSLCQKSVFYVVSFDGYWGKVMLEFISMATVEKRPRDQKGPIHAESRFFTDIALPEMMGVRP